MAIAVMEEQDLQALVEKAFVSGMEKGTELTISLLHEKPTIVEPRKRDTVLINQKKAASILEIDVRTFIKHYRPHLKQASVGATPKFYLNDIEELKSRIKL